MKLLKLIIALLAAVGSFVLAAKAEITEEQAREHLKRGAIVVDVRTVEEFKTSHLTNVVNIPLDQVTVKIPQLVTNKSDVVLLHCRSGRRSGIAEGQLRGLGYTNVFNIGSFEKAAQCLDQVKK
jgi:phage shock protein E